MSILFIGCLSESTHENESSENESNEDSLIGGSINSLEEFQKQFNERDFGDFSAKNLEPVESSNFRKIEIPNPGEVNTATVIKGSVITDEAQISFGTISGKVGDLVTIPVNIMSDGFYDAQHYEHGIVALMTDFTLTRGTPLVNLVSVSTGEATDDWVGMFASAFDLVSNQDGIRYYGVRLGGFQGNGTPITREMGEVTVAYLTFRIVAPGMSEYWISTNWDNIWYYTSNIPMPRFYNSIHARGCEFYNDLVGIFHSVKYQPINARRVLYLSFDHDDILNFGDFSLDIEIPENLEYYGYASGYAATRYYEFFDVTQEGNILHVDARVGNGYYVDHMWVIIGRIDFRKKTQPLGVVTQIKLSNFGGSLAGAQTGCHDYE